MYFYNGGYSSELLKIHSKTLFDLTIARNHSNQMLIELTITHLNEELSFELDESTEFAAIDICCVIFYLSPKLHCSLFQ